VNESLKLNSVERLRPASYASPTMPIRLTAGEERKGCGKRDWWDRAIFRKLACERR